PLMARFALDGKHLLINLGNKEIVQWDLEGRTEKVLWDDKKLEGKLYARSLDLSPNGARLALLFAKLPDGDQPPVTGREPGERLQVVDVASGKSLFQTEDKDLGYGVAISPDNKTVVFGDERLAFWDVAEKQKQRDLATVPAFAAIPLKNLATPASNVKAWQTASAFLFSPDGKLLAAAHGAGDVSLYDA